MTGIAMGMLIFPLFKRQLRNADGDKALSAVPGKFGVALLLIFLTTLLLLLFQRAAYINRAANYLEQLANIAAPYQTEKERLLVRSKFAQIVSRDQYVLLIRSLEELARSHGASVPRFAIY
jgi:hypothetical protein